MDVWFCYSRVPGREATAMLRTLERNLELTNRNLNTPVVPQYSPTRFRLIPDPCSWARVRYAAYNAPLPSPLGSDLTTALGGSDANNWRKRISTPRKRGLD